MARKTIKVDYLARVEGEGAMTVKIKDGQVEDVKLRIFEPPRFFEAFLRERGFEEAPDITARICGICPVAYQMSACHAMEAALGIQVEGTLRELRRLLYCGEWLESHVLHIFMLHAPDFLGYPSAIHMAKDHKELVEMALRLKKIGNALVATVGGREVHPINVRVGGFYRAPTKAELRAHLSDLDWAIGAAEDAVRFCAGLNFPTFEQDYEFVALRHPSEYPFNEGRLISNQGLDIDIADYEDHFEELHVPHSNALHAIHKGAGAYFVGPMARFNLNFDRLPARVQSLAQEVGLETPVKNPFKSIVVRALETLFAFVEAKRIIESYEEPRASWVEAKGGPGRGHGCTEAPRGILYHRYDHDDEGKIKEAKIVPPTSQNQKVIEDDLYHYVQSHIELPDEDLKWQCEQAIRNYDPCISCATHFLQLKVERA